MEFRTKLNNNSTRELKKKDSRGGKIKELN